MQIKLLTILSPLLLSPLISAASTWVGVLHMNTALFEYYSVQISRSGGKVQRPKTSFEDGCKNNPIPEWKSLCLDKAKRRGHFVTSAGNKYCLRAESGTRCGDCDELDDQVPCKCTWTKYWEKPCTW